MSQAMLETIYRRMPSQEKKIMTAWTKHPDMKQELALFLTQYQPVLVDLELKETDLADSYMTMLEDVLNARLEFMRTGAYSCPDFATAQAAVYQDQRRMTTYMLGLALSYFLWGHHYEILSFFRQSIAEIPTQAHCLEIGSGHGLFAANLLTHRPDWRSLDILDISPASLAMTRSIIQGIAPCDRLADINFVRGNIFDSPVDGLYDFVTMGEVLEHVESPGALLGAVGKLLAPHGRFFITTCVNSPAIDHIYQFKTVDEIRQMVRHAGLVIVSERVLPSLDKPVLYMEKNQLDISYAAVLEGVAL